MIDLQRAARAAVVVVFALMLGACATTRGEMALAVPEGAAATGGDKVAVIARVSDAREFQENPSDPSIPSLKKGDDYELDAEGRKRAIARKRNGYGKAMGDILLEGGETVESLSRDLVARGLAERGYRVLDAGTAAPDGALRVDVDIREFWAWFTPGFWAVSMEAKLKLEIRATGPGGADTVTVAGYGINKGQSGREDNWRLAYDRAFENYLAKQREAFDRAGL